MLKKAKVIYYLSDVEESSKKELVDLLKDSDVKNITKKKESLNYVVSFFPPGTILAQSFGIENKNKIICFPIISSHISLPLKQGEFVWYMTDTDSKKKRDDAKEVYNSHPIFSINDYWLSRVHGSLISEDLNYSYKERDGLVSNQKVNKASLEEEENIVLPDFKDSFLFTPDVIAKQKISTKSLYEKGKNTYFGDKATPRKFSKTDELTIQGSYNTLLNLTSTNSVSSQKNEREGLIDIVSGRLALQDFVVDKDEVIVKLGKKTIRNSVSLENKKKEKDFNISTKKYLEITNTSGGKEIFKSPEFYLNEDIKGLSFVENSINYNSDASRVMISESINIDNNKYYDLDFLEEAKDYPDHKQTNKFLINKEYLKDSIIEISNSSTEKIEVESFKTVGNDFVGPIQSVSLPTIFLKSNNIRIVARKNLKNDKDTVPAGNIRLIKEGESFLKYSHILMENDGNISIEGRSVKIGDFRKELMKINNIKSLDNLEEKIKKGNIKIQNDDSFIKNMHGKGYGVLLGYEEKLSEPLVLGNTLVAILSEIININISTLNEILSVTDQQKSDNQAISNFATLIDGQLKTLGAPGATLVFSSDENYNSIIDNVPKEIRRLEDIKKNLTDILSRFSKTS